MKPLTRIRITVGILSVLIAVCAVAALAGLVLGLPDLAVVGFMTAVAVAMVATVYLSTRTR